MSDKSAENLRGMLLLTVAMAGIAGLDSLGKIASRHADSAWVITGVGLGAFVGFLVLMRGQQPLFTRDALNPAALTRTLCEAGASTLMIISLAFVPLSMITVLMQTVPLMITLGAVLFLGERAAWQDWAALAAGFGGMLLIVQPGSEALGPGILITVAATIGFAMLDLASRATPKTVTNSQLGAWGGGALAIVGLIWALISGATPPPMTLATLGFFLAIVALATFSLYCVTAAMRIGDVATIAPFRYTRLVFGIGLGILIFDEDLNLATIIGGAIIVVSGLYVWQRERVRARRAKAA